MEENQIKLQIKFQRLDVYGHSESVFIWIRSDQSLKELKTRIYKKLNIEQEKQHLTLKLPHRIVRPLFSHPHRKICRMTLNR